MFKFFSFIPIFCLKSIPINPIWDIDKFIRVNASFNEMRFDKMCIMADSFSKNRHCILKQSKYEKFELGKFA